MTFFILFLSFFISSNLHCQQVSTLPNEVKEESNSTTINFYDTRDTISHLRYLGNQEYIHSIVPSYRGLQDENVLKDLLEHQNYIDVLNHVWTEKDLDRRIKWLEEKAMDNHSPLFAELAFAYFLKSPTLETYVLKSLPLIQLAKFRIGIDAKCTSDKSALAAMSGTDNYTIVMRDLLTKQLSYKDIADYFIKYVPEYLKIQIEINRLYLQPFIYEKTSIFPSPQWVFSHGLDPNKNRINETKWDKIRIKKAIQLLEDDKEMEQNSDTYIKKMIKSLKNSDN